MIINHCLICDSYIKHNELICDDCRENLENSRLDNYFIRCSKCGYPLLNSNYKCSHCSFWEDSYVFSMYDYRNSFAKQILENYKFNFIKRYSKFYAEILDNFLSENRFDYVIPVPSSLKSLKLRGWDQMKEICHNLNNSKSLNILVNTDSSRSEQKNLNREERLYSSIGKYTVLNSNVDKESKILIVDDVLTTGATLKSCLNALKIAGYKNLTCFAFYLDY